jgi:hypothetical protein
MPADAAEPNWDYPVHFPPTEEEVSAADEDFEVHNIDDIVDVLPGDAGQVARQRLVRRAYHAVVTHAEGLSG